ncbi:MAG TPA: dTDP-4-dehydrorhamnose 3,5-epimerase family protein [Myxococcota bacterium]|nr:dTDP-4-dehydrorhamnose 3,5-epimerase family protein [Myxococcota bacterium]
MIFRETLVPGAFLIELEPHRDERGSFARSFCAREFEAHGLDPRVVQCNLSHNRLRGTLRGLHAQRPPHAEAKLLRCTRGALHDVILDLRPGSAAEGKHVAVTLRAGDGRMLFVPKGVYHGFLTLADDTEVFYQMSEFYEPTSAVGVRWNDPAFGIEWPGEVRVISERDASYPSWRS